MFKPIAIDGAFGEGGGQILRTSLALSLVTGRPLRIQRIRAGRPRPGLRKQHLAAVKAAAAVGRASVSGASLGSCELEFHPGGCYPGDYQFDVGSAGSCGLVLQTVLPALITAVRPSRLLLSGGTHNPFAPPFHFLAKVLLPLLNRMGPQVRAELLQWGFYPAGGGRMAVDITPAPRLEPVDLTARGNLIRGHVRAFVAGLPRHIAERECRTVGSAAGGRFETEVVELPAAAGPGNVVMAEVESANVSELFSAFGRRGVAAEAVARELADQVHAYLEADAPVGPYLADQLLIPFGLAGKGVYRTLPPTRHTDTNAAVVQQFLEVTLSLRQVAEKIWEIEAG
ncbi:MAG: RNA 3'-terminal phosphate cyclase [Desulfobacteraceae bacterium]|nr:MAG: RNA 3'-terminal phosphate cyclase [Desulfobacteraceae bacterium]